MIRVKKWTQKAEPCWKENITTIMPMAVWFVVLRLRHLVRRPAGHNPNRRLQTGFLVCTAGKHVRVYDSDLHLCQAHECDRQKIRRNGIGIKSWFTNVDLSLSARHSRCTSGSGPGWLQRPSTLPVVGFTPSQTVWRRCGLDVSGLLFVGWYRFTADSATKQRTNGLDWWLCWRCCWHLTT